MTLEAGVRHRKQQERAAQLASMQRPNIDNIYVQGLNAEPIWQVHPNYNTGTAPMWNYTVCSTAAPKSYTGEVLTSLCSNAVPK